MSESFWSRRNRLLGQDEEFSRHSPFQTAKDERGINEESDVGTESVAVSLRCSCDPFRSRGMFIRVDLAGRALFPRCRGPSVDLAHGLRPLLDVGGHVVHQALQPDQPTTCPAPRLADASRAHLAGADLLVDVWTRQSAIWLMTALGQTYPPLVFPGTIF